MVPVIGNDCFFLSLKLQDQLLLFAELILCYTEKKQMEASDIWKFYFKSSLIDVYRGVKRSFERGGNVWRDFFSRNLSKVLASP